MVNDYINIITQGEKKSPYQLRFIIFFLLGISIIGSTYWIKVTVTNQHEKKIGQSNTETTPIFNTKHSQHIKENRFEFYNNLPNAQVKVSVVEQARRNKPKDKQDYFLTVATYKRLNNLEAMRVRLLLMGLEGSSYSYVRKDKLKGYVLQLGPFKSRSEVNHIQDKLVANNISSVIVK